MRLVSGCSTKENRSVCSDCVCPDGDCPDWDCPQPIKAADNASALTKIVAVFICYSLRNYNFLLFIVECHALAGFICGMSHNIGHGMIVSRYDICIGLFPVTHALHPVQHM